MAVRISGLVPPGNVGRSQGRPGAKKSEESAEPGASRGEKVDLGANESAVAAVKDASKGVSDVDEAKVAELRAKIASGEYTADLKLVAERLIAEAMAFSG
jgi:flagellar biosynthesis anti-sigma factor FlgM